MNKLFLLVLVTHAITLAATTRPAFRRDYVYEKSFNAFYKLHKTAVQWREARIGCESEGASLLVPETLDEADSVRVLIANILHKYIGVYVGLHDLYSPGTFVTINGQPVMGTILNLLWEHEQPKPNDGHCVAMRRSGKLFASYCEKAKLPFLCKIKMEDVVYRQDCDTYNSDWKLGPTGHCYIVHDEPQTWQTAYSTCLSAGGYLAVLNSRSEADYIRELFKNLTEQRVPDNDFAFLGFSDLFTKHHFRTVHGEKLQSLNYTDWDVQCPGEDQNVTQENRCGGVRRSGLLTSAPCDVPAMFFCEKDIRYTNETTQDTEEESVEKTPGP